MNYYQALQRLTDGRWEYTRRRDNVVKPIGYCTAAPDSDPNKHFNGHATKKEAEDCFRKYTIDRADYGIITEDTQRKCLICLNWTQTAAGVRHGLDTYPLCARHLNRESLNAVVGSFQEIISSY